jgi:hypothetical protein
MSTALYVLSAEYRDAAAKLADMDLDEQTVADTLDGLAGELEAKAQNVALFTRNLEALADQIKAAEAQMAARRKSIEGRAAALRRYLLSNMQTAGIRTLDCPYFRLAVRVNPTSVDVFDVGQVPSTYMRQAAPPPPAPDKAAIKADLAAGRDVPGCRLVQGERLDIR